jgi:hypothetical protein
MTGERWARRRGWFSLSFADAHSVGLDRAQSLILRPNPTESPVIERNPIPSRESGLPSEMALRRRFRRFQRRSPQPLAMQKVEGSNPFSRLG